MNKVIHGVNDGSFQLAGQSAGAIRAALADVFNIPADAIILVNGKRVASAYTLQTNDVLEFCKRPARKGVRRMLTKAEILHEYTSHPAGVLEEMFAALGHDDVNFSGNRIWHDAVIDEWLEEFHARRRTNDG